MGATQKKWLTGVIVVFLYLFILLAGGVLLCYYPASRQFDFVINEAGEIAASSAESLEDTISEAQTANIYIMLYDQDGTLLRYETPVTNLYYVEPTWNISGELSSVLNGKSVRRIVFARGTGRIDPDFMLLAGEPVTENGVVTGAAFVGKNLMDVPYMLAAYVIFFTICYWITAVVFLHSRRRARQLDQMKKDYVNNMTHALKTPIASIKALSETLCDGVEPDPEKQQMLSGMILSEANRQSQMVTSILDLSKLQNLEGRLPREHVAVKDLFEPVREKYQMLMDCSGIDLQWSDTLNSPLILDTNPEYIRQVIEILLDNALKFVEEGGKVCVKISAAGRKATVSVQDDGPGISEKALPHVFERFYKSSHDINHAGNGLGLAIAKEICDRLGERIWVESRDGNGACFFFTVKIGSRRSKT